MKKCHITIIGSGGTALAAAAELTKKGCAVTLCDTEERKDRLQAVTEQRGIILEGASEEKDPIMPQCITTNFGEAVSGAQVLLICVRAERHRDIALRCSPFFQKGQVCVISPGNLGSVIFYEEAERRGKAEILFGEVSGNLCPCRLTGSARVLQAAPVRPKHLSAFPAVDTERVIEALEGVFDFIPGRNIGEGLLNSPNLPAHLPGTLLSASAVEKLKGEFALYAHGLTPTVLRCAEGIEEERNQVLAAMGWDSYGSAVEKLYPMTQKVLGPVPALFHQLKGPGGMTDRYITEDAPCGVAFLVSLGRATGVDTRISQAFLTLASFINGEDYYQQGRTLEAMGISDKGGKAADYFFTYGKMRV